MATILIIEDEETVRENLVELLSAEGYTALAANDGANGLERARAALPDLILCDIFMPELGGYGVLAALRQDEATADIPFIFLTALTDREDQRKGMELGADDFITKPFTREEILTAIQMRLDRKASQEDRIRRQVTGLQAYLSGALPHELLAPLSLILDTSRRLAEHADPEAAQMAGDVHKAANRLLASIRDYLLYAELESLASDPARLEALTRDAVPSSTAAITDTVREIAAQAGRAADVSLDLERSVLQISELYLGEIVEKLVDNCLAGSTPGTLVRITGRASPEHGEYRLRVEDHGQAVTPAQAEALRGRGPLDYKIVESAGVGVGLFLAKRLVSLHGGRLEIAFGPGEVTALEAVFRLDGTA